MTGDDEVRGGVSAADARRADTATANNVISTMLTTGIVSCGRRLAVSDIAPDSSGTRGTPPATIYSCRVEGQSGELVLCPTDWTAGGRFVDRAVAGALARDGDVKHVIISAWAWEADQRDKRTDRRGKLTIHQVQANQDLKLGELKAEKNDVAFVSIGEPDIDIGRTEEGQLYVTVEGYDSYNPRTGAAERSDGGDII